MGLMFSRRRAQAAKDLKSAKAQAHSDNHAARLEEHGETAFPKAKSAPAQKVKSGADKLGAK